MRAAWFPVLGSLAALLATGCGRKQVAVAPPPPPVPVPAAPAPMPVPPAGAAASLRIPPRLADGSYATPNHGIGAAARSWHLRSALNVAALQCASTVADQYNAAIRLHAAELKAAHGTLEREYRSGGADWQDRFDDSMTRVYNYWAQPPVHAGFCAAAEAIAGELAAVPAGGFGSFADRAMPQLEQPFVAFYQQYDSYRVALAAWHAERMPQVPRLAVDRAVLIASDEVTGGGGRFAGR